MNKEVICTGISVCDIHCEHNTKHYNHTRCESKCMRHKTDYHCKDYNIVTRKLKLKKLNERTS